MEPKEKEWLQMSNYSGPPEYKSLECFQIERRIGKGQFSVVYRAKCLTNKVLFMFNYIKIKLINL